MTAIRDLHALVTGANRGIGAAIARALDAEGARVTLLVRDAAKATAVADALTGAHVIVEADVTDAAALHRAIATAVATTGPVDILVNNAGYASTAPFLRTSPEAFAAMLAVHLMSVVYATQAVLPSMVERGRGRIVNIASIAGLAAAPFVSAYVAAKHAQVGLTRALATEFGPKGIGVDAVCPGYVDTDLVGAAVDRIVAKTGRTRTEAMGDILASAAQPRVVTADEVARAVVALCTTPPGGPAGQTIVLDGRDTP